MCVGVGFLRGIRDCGCGTICSYVGLGCSCVEGGRYFCHLLSGLLILVVVGLPLGCCEFVCVGLPHLFFWRWSSIVLLFFRVTSVFYVAVLVWVGLLLLLNTVMA